MLNVAVTVVFPVIVTFTLVAEPAAPPDQPANVLPVFGVAVKVTTVPLAYEAAEGLTLTVPEPIPSMMIVSV